MTDKEIFANEILCIRRRASGRCNGGTDCDTCDLLMSEVEIIEAYQRAMKNIDLINRQKAEIERFQNILVSFMSEVGTWSNKYDVDIFTIHKIPILAKEDFNVRNKIKIEAYKEFAKIVYRFFCDKQNWYTFKESWLENGECYWLKQKLNNLVKEMEG